MGKPQVKRSPKGKGKDAGRKFKKKVSVLNSESIEYVDWKDVNLLRRFISDRAKVRARGDQERPRDGVDPLFQPGHHTARRPGPWWRS
jgi:ribosomal protein S18